MGSCRTRSVYLTTRFLGRLSPHVYWAGLVIQAVNQYCAHSFARNWQLPFLNQRKGENDRRKYFMINLRERMLPTSAGFEPATSWSPVGRASNCATEAVHRLLDNSAYSKLAQWQNRPMTKSAHKSILTLSVWILYWLYMHDVCYKSICKICIWLFDWSSIFHKQLAGLVMGRLCFGPSCPGNAAKQPRERRSLYKTKKYWYVALS